MQCICGNAAYMMRQTAEWHVDTVSYQCILATCPQHPSLVLCKHTHNSAQLINQWLCILYTV